MWTDEQRKKHKPQEGRYPSDVTDEEWAIIEPMIPPARRSLARFNPSRRFVFTRSPGFLEPVSKVLEP